jgi:hypothetical protein
VETETFAVTGAGAISDVLSSAALGHLLIAEKLLLRRMPEFFDPTDMLSSSKTVGLSIFPPFLIAFNSKLGNGSSTAAAE